MQNELTVLDILYNVVEKGKEKGGVYQKWFSAGGGAGYTVY